MLPMYLVDIRDNSAEAFRLRVNCCISKVEVKSVSFMPRLFRSGASLQKDGWQRDGYIFSPFLSVVYQPSSFVKSIPVCDAWIFIVVVFF